ncbi:MAG TPA: hypothetical protein P5026_02475 [Kiritimatiellia bacterium]|nr:hypothetical protein [Kiritimatiellia bacterium]HRU69654.1 hypothetical protein [Kiritimatiellia bacterium]
MKRILLANVVGLAVGIVLAKDIFWTAAVNNNWDTGKTANWSGNQTFATGDNVTIRDAGLTDKSVMMTARVQPGDVIFDITDHLDFGWGDNNTYGLHVDTKSFTKTGPGTLLLRSDLSGTEKMPRVTRVMAMRRPVVSRSRKARSR